MDGWIDEEQWLGAEGEEQVDREEIPRWEVECGGGEEEG